MSIREILERNKKLTVCTTLLAICALVGITGLGMLPDRRPSGEKACYSDDEGQTWFVDSTYKVVPFDHNGKQAVRAFVVTYQDGKKQFVSYLMRNTPKGQKALSDALAKASAEAKPAASLSQLFFDGSLQEVKLPGPEHKWVPRLARESVSVTTVQSPDGSEIDMLIP